MKGIWNNITVLGLLGNPGINEQTSKRLKFFNQVLFMGIFAALAQILFIWPFIGVKSLVLLPVCLSLILSLYLNSRQRFTLSKWIYVISVNSMGTYSTLLLGGASLYHIQALLILMSCLIMFDFKTEKALIFAGVPFMITSILIGEFNLFSVPDFSDHPLIQFARIANITSLIGINVIFFTFIIRINNQNESKLRLHKIALEKGKNELEVIVQERTSELEAQKTTLLDQNKEKEILLKEVHHRVRNNLQVITSLVNLQLSKTVNQDTKNALIEIQSRVESMSLVHKRMYETSDFQKIDVNEYLQNIIENMQQMYGHDNIDLKLTLSEGITLDMEHAIPFGLITNEIIANFFKHGRLENDALSKISICLAAQSDIFSLKIQDNGPGFPEGLQLNELNSIGLMLISSLVEQLDGTLHCYNEKGAVYDINIPVNAHNLVTP